MLYYIIYILQNLWENCPIPNQQWIRDPTNAVPASWPFSLAQVASPSLPLEPRRRSAAADVSGWKQHKIHGGEHEWQWMFEINTRQKSKTKTNNRFTTLMSFGFGSCSPARTATSVSRVGQHVVLKYQVRQIMNICQVPTLFSTLFHPLFWSNSRLTLLGYLPIVA